MLKHYLVITWRNIRNNKVFTLINIFGLSIGLACTFIIWLWIKYEVSYDKFNVNKNRLYKVSYQNSSYILPAPLAKYLSGEFPEIKYATVYQNLDELKLTIEDKGFYSNGVFVNETFFKMFSFPILEGDKESVFTNPNSIVITQGLAKKFFGNENPIGKTIQLVDHWNMTVTGVLKNLPSNTQFQFEFLIPYEVLPEQVKNNWNVNSLNIYVLLANGSSYIEVNKKIAGVIKKFIPKSDNPLALVPLSRWYLYDLEGGGRIKNIYILSSIAFLVLLIACINFMNLSTALSEKRAKEIGLKKIVGSKRKQFISQYLLESLFISFLAFFLAIILIELFLPSINQFFNIQISLTYLSITSLLFVMITIFMGLLVGCYPAFIISSFKSIDVLRSDYFSSNRKRNLNQIISFRNILVVFQFMISIVLLIIGITIQKQNQFIERQNMGYNKENVMVIQMQGKLSNIYNNLKNQLLQLPEVLHISYSSSSNTRWNNSSCIDKWDNKEQSSEVCIGFDWIGYDYDQTLGIKMVNGRFLSPEFPTDANDAIVINEAAAKAMNLDNPIGKVINNFLAPGKDLTIIGVMKSFNSESLHYSIEPYAYIYGQSRNFLYIKISSEKTLQTVKKIESIVKETVPNDPFKFEFLEEKINNLYKEDRTTGILINYGTLIAVIISCLGLFGLTFYAINRRTKEVGIRKANGARVAEIMFMFSKNFTKLVIIAFVIASPIAYYVINKWLKNFAYKTDLSWWIFALAGLIAYLIALLTVGWQSWRVASRNPVEALRYE